MRFPFFVFVTLLLSTPAKSDAIDARSAPSLGSAYGFVVGQNMSLAAIEAQLPDLAREVALARLAFDRRFPRAEARLGERLEGLLEERFAEVDARLRSDLGERIGTVDREAAVAFLVEVRNRDRDTIPTEILRPLLIGVFSDPLVEMAAGFVQRYRTDGSGKALGLELALEVPASFSGQEGRRPHVLQQWTSLDGRGSTFVNIGVMDIGESISVADLRAEYGPAFVRDMLDDDAELLDHGMIVHEGFPGVWVTTIEVGERAGTSFVAPRFFSLIYVRERAVSLTCGSVLPADRADEAEATMTRLEPLCRSVLNSLIPFAAYR